MQRRALTIHKFGGSCLESPEAFGKTLGIIKSFTGAPCIAVLSAFKGVTDKLVEIMDVALDDDRRAIEMIDALEAFHVDAASRAIRDGASRDAAVAAVSKQLAVLRDLARAIFSGGLPRSLRDHVLSFGERLSACMFSFFLNGEALDATFVSGEAIIVTTSEFGNAMPLMEPTRERARAVFLPLLRSGTIPVVAGYYAADEKGHVTTLGRGGTDFTATIIANVLGSDVQPEVVFWKDVDGLLTANPRIEPGARLIEHISYDEAKELAFFGSKVLHPLCLRMTMDTGIPVQIRNFNRPIESPFTRISHEKVRSEGILKSIASIDSCTMITLQGAAMVSLPGIAAKLFALMASNKVNVLFISQASSENNITFVVSKEDGERATAALHASRFFKRSWFEILHEEASLVAVVGHGMPYQPGVSGKIFTALGDAGVNVRAIAQGSAELNISIIVAPQDLARAIRSIHGKFVG